MGRTIGSLGALVGLSLLFAACSGSSKTSGNDPEPNVCLAGSRTCAGLIVKVCNDEGTALVTEKTCVAPQTCADGACAETTCVPNTKHCKDGSVWKCDSTGGGSTLSQTCSKSQFCREADDSATCSDVACKAGEKLCDGNIATSCEADGSGPKEGGVDCSDKKQTCYQGACQDNECMPGAKVCQDGDVYLCGKNGSDTSLLADCQAGTVCDGEKLACTTKICEAGAASCDGKRAVTCNAYGTGWDPSAIDCAATNQVCVAGACQKTTCVPGGTFCDGGNVHQCDKLGVSSSVWHYCSPTYQHCQPYPSSNYAFCEDNACSPGQTARCYGNEVRACNPDGSAAATGTDCGVDKYCESGECKPLVCQPGIAFCKDGDIYSCSWNGTYAELNLDCPTDTTCDIDAFACVPLPCSPGDTVCLGNKVGKCAADGQTLGTVTEDCTAAGSICGVDNKCVKSVVETVGLAEDATTIYAESLIGDVVKASSPRTLTEMQAYLVLPSARSLRWVVFEETATYTFTAKKDWVVANQTGTGFFSSGPISYALKAGKTYLLGVSVSGGNTSIAYFDTAPFALTASFGTVLGSVTTSYSSIVNASADYNFVYQMKLTTAP
jgi:hypothetical protein